MKKKLVIKLIIVVLVLCFIVIADKLSVFKSEATAKEDGPKVIMLAKDNPEVGCGVYVYRCYVSTGYYDFVVVSRQYQGGVAVTQLR